jgi:anti-sigma regulatory factor (Ser/Thr protein kinase)
VFRLHDISLYVLELIENSIRAKAGVVAVAVEFDFASDRLRVSVEDDGEGISLPAEQVLDPFYTTCDWKRVGLGLSLLRGTAEATGGELEISRSRELGGAAVTAVLGLGHVDRPPLGDLASTLSTMILTSPEIDFRLRMKCADKHYSFRLSEFARNYGLSSEANVALASAAFQILRRDLEIWKRIELSCFSRTLTSADAHRLSHVLSAAVGARQMEQGADA